jgi:hypothetical protein
MPDLFPKNIAGCLIRTGQHNIKYPSLNTDPIVLKAYVFEVQVLLCLATGP